MKGKRAIGILLGLCLMLALGLTFSHPGGRGKVSAGEGTALSRLWSISFDELIEHRLGELRATIEELGPASRDFLLKVVEQIKEALSMKDYLTALYAINDLSYRVYVLTDLGEITRFEQEAIRLSLTLVSSSISMLAGLEERMPLWICIGQYEKEGQEPFYIGPQVSNTGSCYYTSIGDHELTRCKCFDPRVPPIMVGIREGKEGG